MPCAGYRYCSPEWFRAEDDSDPCTSTTTGACSPPGGRTRRPARSTPRPRKRVSSTGKASLVTGVPSTSPASQLLKLHVTGCGSSVQPRWPRQRPSAPGASVPVVPSRTSQRSCGCRAAVGTSVTTSPPTFQAPTWQGAGPAGASIANHANAATPMTTMAHLPIRPISAALTGRWRSATCRRLCHAQRPPAGDKARWPNGCPSPRSSAGRCRPGGRLVPGPP